MPLNPIGIQSLLRQPNAIDWGPHPVSPCFPKSTSPSSPYLDSCKAAVNCSAGSWVAAKATPQLAASCGEVGDFTMKNGGKWWNAGKMVGKWWESGDLSIKTWDFARVPHGPRKPSLGGHEKTPISRVGLETNKHNWGSPHCSNLHILYLVVYYGWWYRRYGSSGTLTLWKMVPFFGSMIYVISKKMNFHSRLLKYHRITKDIMGTDLVYSPPKKCLKKK